MLRLIYTTLLLVPVFADYDCVCNYNVEEGVYGVASKDGQPIGYLYEFDCKPQAGPESNGFHVVMYEHHLAYVEQNAQVQVQTCPGEIPDEDKLTTVASKTTLLPTVKTTITQTTITQTTTRLTTTPMPTTTPKPTTTPVPTTTPAPTTVTTSAALSTGIPEGHIDACPDYIKNTDVNRYHGFLGQYGEFCYELIDTPTQWGNAERHCALVSKGHLVQVLNQGQQDFLVRFLNNHHYVKGVWLGLTDSGDNSVKEGTWRWITGAAYQYNNFQSEYAQHSSTTHKLNDCVLFKQGGEWTDVSCGTSLAFGVGFGETHPYICQYNISSTLPSILDAIPHVVVG